VPSNSCAKLYFGSREFDRTLGVSLFKRRVELADFAFRVLLCGNIAIDEGKQGASTERDCRRHDAEWYLSSIKATDQPLEAKAALVRRDFYQCPRLLNREPFVRLTLGKSLRWRSVAQSLPFSAPSSLASASFASIYWRVCGSRSDMASALRSKNIRKRVSFSSGTPSGSPL
jgi:hypothetical protein